MHDKHYIIKRLETKSYARGLVKVLIIEMSMQNARKVTVDEAWEALSKKLEDKFREFYREV